MNIYPIAMALVHLARVKERGRSQNLDNKCPFSLLSGTILSTTHSLPSYRPSSYIQLLQQHFLFQWIVPVASVVKQI